MPLYDNAKCPVCKRQFEEGDDVVFCPECGTPHHRECYKSVGHCANEPFHSTGFNFYEQSKSNKLENIVEEAKAYIPPVFPFAGRENNIAGEQQAADDKEKTQPIGTLPPFAVPQFNTAYDRDTDKIDGESVSDVAAVVSTNVPRFVNIFKQQEKTGKKTSWNWGAFFFGPYYFLYRKMFKPGILLFVLNVLLSYGQTFAVTKLAPKATEAILNYTNTIAQGKFNFSEYISYMQQLQAAADYSKFMVIFGIFAAVSLTITIIFTVLADYIYKKTVSQIIKNVSQQLEDGASFQSSVMIDTGMNFSQEQMRKMYLSRRGGTSILIPLAAIMLWYLITVML